MIDGFVISEEKMQSQLILAVLHVYVASSRCMVNVLV
jgi:hypothetical protein